jgi:hypothetical protein
MTESPALANLFEPPPPPLRPLEERQTTQVASNQSNERTSLLFAEEAAASTAFYNLKAWRDNPHVDTDGFNRNHPNAPGCWRYTQRLWYKYVRNNAALATLWEPTTFAGAFMFLLYHVVFCLAFGSALQRPHATSGTGGLGVMAKFTAVGIFGGAGFLYIYRLNADIPAVYPSVDLFLAPFVVSLPMQLLHQCLHPAFIRSIHSTFFCSILCLPQAQVRSIDERKCFLVPEIFVPLFYSLTLSLFVRMTVRSSCR